MKQLRLFITLVIGMLAVGLSAQELPQAINFQAIARDANGQPLANANIMLQLTVIDGTPEGPEVYREIRSLQTNAYGGFNFQLGREPNMANGVFADIDWANGRKFLKVDYDPTNTMSFGLSLGTIEFISVPYAFVAGEVSYIDATNASDGDVLVFNAATGHFEPQAIGTAEETDPTVPDWAKESQKPTYDYSEILNTPEIPEVPENVSAFNNDAGYLTSYTEVQALSMSGDTVFLTGGSYVVLPEEKQSIADVAAKGNEVNTQLKNVTDPTEAQDAVTLAYLDAKIAELNEKIEQLQELMNTPEGAINGLFSVSETRKVYFSKGNLQYQASTNTWRFAENQWDYIGNDNANISSTYIGWIDLFGWGTGNNPTNSSTSESDYSGFTDWGSKRISNGGNQANLWRTLTKNEWDYLISTRTTTSGIRYAKATVNGVVGVIILPDDWSSTYYSLSNTNTSGAAYTTNTITLTDWISKFEAHGAVFLPAAGNRYGTSVVNVGTRGSYWSSTPNGSDFAYGLYFYGSSLGMDNSDRYYARSVRLVAEE